jgi:hypothetical protein
MLQERQTHLDVAAEETKEEIEAANNVQEREEPRRISFHR